MLRASMSRLLVGRYELLAEIGQGAMGIVYEARHLATLGRCAVKILRAEVASDATTVQRFLREARASSAVVSDYVVRVFDADTDPDTACPFLVMEFLEGEDLRKALQRLKVLTPTAAVKIVLQVALGLVRAHAAGVVHRDIKPENLFLTRSESGKVVVKILDFGVAKVRHPEVPDRLLATTRTDAVLGTPLYMSPEHLRPDVEVGSESDVWALGIVLWELLTGGAPFVANTLPALKSLILEQDAPSVRSRAPWVETDVADIVSRALARDPAQRYATAAEFRDALAKVCNGPELASEELKSVDVGSLFVRGYGDLLTATTAVSADSAPLVPSATREKSHKLTFRLLAGAGIVGLLSLYGLVIAQLARREPGELRAPQVFPAVAQAEAAIVSPRAELAKALSVPPVASAAVESKPPPRRKPSKSPAVTRPPAPPPRSEPGPTAAARFAETLPQPAVAPSPVLDPPPPKSVDPRTGLLTRFKVPPAPAVSVSKAPDLADMAVPPK